MPVPVGVGGAPLVDVGSLEVDPGVWLSTVFDGEQATTRAAPPSAEIAKAVLKASARGRVREVRIAAGYYSRRARPDKLLFVSSWRRRIALFFGVLSCLLGAASCSGSSIQLCGTIPEGGCPIGRGGTCDDPSCTGVYNCLEGDWTLEFACDGGGGAGGGGSSSSDASSSASACISATFDHTGEVTGCKPDLEHPDCPVDAAEGCNPCLTSCVDFFMCTSEGWKDLAYCTEEGDLVIVQ